MLAGPPAAGAPDGLRGRPEAELPLPDRDLEPDVRRQPLQELPVAGAGLGHVVVDRGGAGDLTDLQPGALGDLEGDVGGGHLRVRLGAPAPEQPVRRVVPAQHGERAPGVELALQRGDLAGHQRHRRLALARRDRDLDRGADLGTRLREHQVRGIAEPELEQVGVALAVVDVRRGEQGREG